MRLTNNAVDDKAGPSRTGGMVRALREDLLADKRLADVLFSAVRVAKLSVNPYDRAAGTRWAGVLRKGLRS
jgi:hypothetical protein